jgi:predicted MPP superfamily phosphohydrolase
VHILLVADLHYTLPQLDWVVKVAPEFDLVVLAGDLVDITSAVPIDAQTVVLLRYLGLIREQTQLAVGSGNHDLTGPDANLEFAGRVTKLLVDERIVAEVDTADRWLHAGY